MPHRTLTLAASVLVFAAGSAASASDLQVSKSGTVSYHGQVVRSSSRAISRDRLVHVPNSSKLVATWDESGPTGIEHFYAISPTGEAFANAFPTSYDVRLVYASFDPLAGEPVVPEPWRAGPGSRAYMVQFIVPPQDEFRRDIASMGGAVRTFLTDHTHVVDMDAKTAASVARLPYVRWVGPYHPAYKMSRDVRAELLSAAPDAAAKRYSIECFSRGDAAQQAVAGEVTRLGGIVEVTTPGQYRLEATLTPAQVLAIARMNEVNFIDPWGGPGGTDMNVVRQLVGAVPTLSNAGYTGQGVRGEVFDTEVRTTHQAFQTPPVLLHGGSAGDVANLHGSACYGINFANWPANPNYNGLVTNAAQGMYCYYPLSTQFGGTTTRLTFNTEATNPAGAFKSCYQTSSVGSAQITDYSTISAETDDYLFLVDYLSCQSQSNTGNMTSRPQAWAKNIVSVGGIAWQGTLSRADDAWTSASFGPAADGRQKPDLANCYDNIPSTFGGGDASTTVFNGTSGATPITAGCFGLLSQMWHEGVWSGFGGGASVFSDRPRSTTAKAMMINTAYRYPLTQGGLVRAKQGWGMPALDALYNIRAKTVIVNEPTPLLQNETATYHFNVGAGEPQVAFTMVYPDPKGNPAAAQTRINDLTLRVTDPNGVQYWGNVGLNLSNVSAPGGVPNTVDTVENVFVANPAAGDWTAEVMATSIVQDGYLPTAAVNDAVFSLVATGVAPGIAPPLNIQVVSGLPDLIAPGTPTDITVRVIPGSQNLVPGTQKMFYRVTGAGPFTQQIMLPLTGNDYRATLPALSCGNTAQYYFSAQGDQGAIVTRPQAAPASYFSAPVGTVGNATLMDVDFDTAIPAGWSATGLWQVTGQCPPPGTPCAGTQAAYYGVTTGSQCTYDTGVTNSGLLTAPPLVLPSVPAGGAITLSFCYALQTENLTGWDKAEVLVNGAPVATMAEAASWTSASINLSTFTGQTVTLAFRFDTGDGAFNTFRGWHIDRVRVTATTSSCTDPCYANCDGSTTTPRLTANDFQCFLNRFAAGESYANCDGSTATPALTANDFQCFMNKYAAGCS